MPKRIEVSHQWQQISDLYPGTQPTDIFKGQVVKGVVMVASEAELPATNDHFTFRSKAEGGFTDEWFQAGAEGKKAFVRSASATKAEIIVEVVV
ncbi:TPA: hypothetical protein ACMDTO_000092 [Vibrio cholerae]|uniref:hypothetical protein n=1 Tax=Vibrio cholerae TaxID=666 RepID=UPI0000EF9A7D|nr:hypothetical protein [Vibrio cholerae]EGR2105460.1 hypothetical protein [Vibrio cholerae]EGR2446700.1 hypothetical protein [Vibrio cholerae]EGR4280928.1 hypothetical protein [Vibrio cholerae]EJY0882902.1 hypothetical protein [Vibrio cholerae]EKF9624952.1 hypothetical protein [Vibrio cholerae]